MPPDIIQTLPGPGTRPHLGDRPSLPGGEHLSTPFARRVGLRAPFVAGTPRAAVVARSRDRGGSAMAVRAGIARGILKPNKPSNKIQNDAIITITTTQTYQIVVYIISRCRSFLTTTAWVK